MASDVVLDINGLLQPVSDEAPAGADLRLDAAPDSKFSLLRAADRDARAAEKPTFEGEIPEAREEWQEVSKLSQDLLRSQAKDLQIGCWLLEATVRLNGFAGLRDGLRLVRELTERFWDDVHPRQDAEPESAIPDPDDDEDEENRGSNPQLWPISGLNGGDRLGPLVMAIGRISLTAGPDGGSYSLWKFQQANELALLEADKRQQRIEDQGAISREMFDRAVSETAPEFLTELWEDITACREELDQLEQFLDQRCDGKVDEEGEPLVPPLGNIDRILKECCETLQLVAPDVLGPPEGSEGEPSEQEPEDGPGQPGISGPIGSREQAFRTLQLVAKFFRETEPHSPLSYTLDKVVRWGGMGLPELWSELIRDESARSSMFREVGIPKSDSDYDE